MDRTIGKPLRRVEDERLLTGRGQFSDDVNLPGQAFAAMVRSPHAHALIRRIDGAAARDVPGVIAVLTGTDWLADGLGPMAHGPGAHSPTDPKITAPGGGGPLVTPHFPLPADKARYAGEAVAMVVAESAAAARDGAERVAVDWQPFAAVTDSRSAIAAGAPVVWDSVAGNLCIDCEIGDAAATDAAFAEAAHVVRMAFFVGRVTGVPMEPRAAVGAYDPARAGYVLHAGSGGPVRHRNEIAKLFAVAPEKVRVVSGDVGGNYGTRNRVYPEFPLVLWAAKRLGRPVKWTCDRAEAMLSDVQGRDLYIELAMALDRDGRFLALEASNLSNIGAHTVSFTPLLKGAGIVTGPYAFPTSRVRLRGALTNTPPTNSYRSAGRPEVIYALERLIDRAARDCGFDRVELRRRNLIPPDRMPFANPQGMVYDSGEFERTLDLALDAADWTGYPARQAASAARGRRRGIAVTTYLETSSGAPVERADIAVRPDHVEVVVGTQSSGQGHETSFAQVAADWLGVPHAAVRLVQGDTDIVKVGGGSHAGRSMRMAGTAIVLAAGKVIEKGRRLAAHALEAAVEDIAFADGRFAVRGTDRAVGIFELARFAERSDLPAGLEGGLADGVQNTMAEAVFPNGCHVCEVEVDPETGAVAIDRYTSVDDVGRVINPLIVDGQIHGGIAQGAGQALMEACVFDPATGQPLAGSFMDYCLPRADDMPSFTVVYNEVISLQNPLGVKSGGESGTTPAPAVIVNAVVDALAGLGVSDLTMPVTPCRVWQAIRAARV